MSELYVQSTGEYVSTGSIEALVAAYEAAARAKATADADLVKIAEATEPFFGVLRDPIRVGKLHVSINPPKRGSTNPETLRELLAPLVSPEVLAATVVVKPQSYQVVQRNLTKLRKLDDEDIRDAIDLATEYEDQSRRLTIKAVGAKSGRAA